MNGSGRKLEEIVLDDWDLIWYDSYRRAAYEETD